MLADNQNQSLLDVAPLQWIVGVVCWHWEKSLPVCCIITLHGLQVNGSRDTFFMSMTVQTSVRSRHDKVTGVEWIVSLTCERDGEGELHDVSRVQPWRLCSRGYLDELGTDR